MKTFLNFRNNLTMLYKCLPDSELSSVMRWRWFLDYLAAWEMLLLKRNWGISVLFIVPVVHLRDGRTTSSWIV